MPQSRFASDRMGRPNTSPNLWSVGDHSYALVAGRTAQLVIWDIDRATGAKSSFNFGDIVGDPLNVAAGLEGTPEHPDEGDGQTDDKHYAMCIGIDDAGYIWVAANMHTDPLRIVKSVNPFDISSWVEASGRFDLSWGSNLGTYGDFLKTDDGTLHFWWSQRHPDERLTGRSVVYHRLSAADAAAENNWEPFPVAGLTDGIFLYRPQADPGGTTTGDGRAYLMNLAAQGNKIGIFAAWRVDESWSVDDGVGPGMQQDLCYIESNDGGATWTSITGDAVTMPLEQAHANTVPNCAIPGMTEPVATGNRAAFDGDGRPFLIVDDEGVEWDGSSWVVSAVPGSYSAGFVNGQKVRIKTLANDDGASTIRGWGGGDIMLFGQGAALNGRPMPDPEAEKQGVLRFVVPDRADEAQLYEYGSGALLA